MMKPELKNIPIELLKPGKYQTRRTFDQESLQELAESIKSEGLIQPIIVRPIVGHDNRYEIVAGERRWRAAQLTNIDVVICLVKDYSDKQVAAITPIENVQREDLNPIEEACAYQYLIDEFEYIHEEVAAAVGKSRTKITNLLRLLKLDTKVQELLVSGDLNEGHGKIIAGLPYNLQYKLAKKAAKQSWSLRKLEQEIKKTCEVDSSKLVKINNAYKNNPSISALERIISVQVGSEVKLESNLNKKGGERGGWLKIRYYNNEILTGILDRLGIKYDE